MASAWLGQFDHKDLRPFPHSLPFARRRAYGMTMRVLTTAGVRRDKRHCALLSLSPSAGPLPFPGRTPPRTHRLASRGGRPRIVYRVLPRVLHRVRPLRAVCHSQTGSDRLKRRAVTAQALPRRLVLSAAGPTRQIEPASPRSDRAAPRRRTDGRIVKLERSCRHVPPGSLPGHDDLPSGAPRGKRRPTRCPCY